MVQVQWKEKKIHAAAGSATRAQWNNCNESLIQQMLHFAANIQIIHKEAVLKTCVLFIIAQWTLHANVF